MAACDLEELMVYNCRKLVDKAKQLSRQNQDQENWYFVPVSTPLAEKERKWQEMKKNKFNSD